MADPAESGYQQLLSAAVESARVAVAADAAFAMMADEDGDLRLRAAAGDMPAVDAESRGGPASVLTVPFVVDGRVTGLLAVTSQVAGKFGDPEMVRLQWLADRSGPALQRAWLGELGRIRRGRLGALAEARGLLTAGLGQDDIMALVGRSVVPRLAPWCAVLTPAARDGGLRTAYVRHTDDRLVAALAWLLDGACQVAAPDCGAGREAAARPGCRWPLMASDLAGAPPGAGDLAAAPPEAAGLAAGTAWCFPLGDPQDAMGVFVIGDAGEDRLPREVAALAADLACRAGLALDGARLVAHKV